jgi:hypothetical protein
MATLRSALAQLLATVDGALNTNMSDVIGNKSDTSAGTSIVSLVKDAISEIEIVEEHFHGDERWYGKAVTAVGENHVADLMSLYVKTTFAIAPFRIDAGDSAWGAWVQILGATDTPMEAGKTYYDFHKILITLAEDTAAVTFIQIGAGATGDEAFANKTYTTIAHVTSTVQAKSSAINFMFKRHAVGTKCWARSLSIGKNTSWVDFYIGLHEY